MFANVMFQNNEVKRFKVKLAALTRKDCEKCPELLKYFRNGNTELDRFHIPEISAERYEEIAKDFKRTSRFNEANLKMATATDYYLRKARVQALADELGVSPNFLDLTDYTWNEDFYTTYSIWRQVDELDDAWREAGEDLRYASAYKVYVEMEAKNTALDLALYNTLYHFCYTAIVNRKAMLMCKVDKCLGFLHSIAEYSNGFTENISGSQVGTMKSYLNFFTELLSDESAVEFIYGTNDVELFGKNEAMHSDYVETYRGMLRGIVRGGSLEDFRISMSKVEDPFLDEILADLEEEVLSGAYLKDVKA